METLVELVVEAIVIALLVLLTVLALVSTLWIAFGADLEDRDAGQRPAEVDQCAGLHARGPRSLLIRS